MLIVNTKSTDPYWNLALEEYLVTGFNEEIFRLWQNSPAIIVGRNQNTLSEINYDYVTEHDLPVVRRMSGGGAVFHDLGNINFTFVTDAADKFNDYSHFTLPIIDALKSLGVNAELSGRNDLLIDGKKFSGNAQYQWKGRMLHHGTLLLSSCKNDITAALRVNPLKIQSKGIKSVASRITNINDHLAKPVSVSELINLITKTVIQKNPSAVEHTLSSIDLANIEKLVREKYSTYEWNYGYSPKYSFKKEAYFPCGHVEANLDVNDGKISAVRLFGDYFGKCDVSLLESKLTGIKHSREDLQSVLTQSDLSVYLSGISAEELLSILI